MSAYISEVGYTDDPENFFEVAVPAGTDISGYSIAIYDASSVLQTNLSFGTPDITMQGQDVYSFDSASPGYAEYGASEALALIDGEGNVVQFVSFEGKTVTPSSGPAAGETSTNLGFLESGETFETSDDGATYSAQSSPNQGTIPCYALGTLVDTPDGPRAVETLKAGDLVITYDNGLQAIRWTRRSDHPLEDVDDDSKPVQIKAGALGKNLPAQDLIISPQHRILVGGAGQLQQAFASEAFAPAKSLTAVPGVRHMRGKARITWIHFAFDRHEVVRANGCLSESLLLGPMVVNGITETERRALRSLFGPTSTPNAALNDPPARDCLKVGVARRQIAKHLKEDGHLVVREIRKWDRDLAIEKYEAERMREAAFMDQSREEAIHIA